MHFHAIHDYDFMLNLNEIQIGRYPCYLFLSFQLVNQVIKHSLESTRKRQREKENGNGPFSIKKARIVPITESKITFSDVGGSDKVLKTVCKLLAHMKHPEIFKQLGISPPRGFLLHGPPGCGKTLLAHAVAGVR